MSPPLWLWLALSTAIVVAVLVVIFWVAVHLGHGVGNHGLVQRSRLTCPRCSGTFDYDWVPGVALTAVRLGRGRYMWCPLCHRGSYFDLLATMRARNSADLSEAGGQQTP